MEDFAENLSLSRLVTRAVWLERRRSRHGGCGGDRRRSPPYASRRRNATEEDTGISTVTIYLKVHSQLAKLWIADARMNVMNAGK
jgi:hypothetical protein